MANISSAEGTITLGGEGWDKNSIEALNNLFECVINNYTYGTHLVEEFRAESGAVTFIGEGRWSYANNLKCFDDWIREYIKKFYKPHTKSELKPADLLKTYEDLIMNMSKNGLFLEFDFIDYEAGNAWICSTNGRLAPSDGVLVWTEASCDDLPYAWDTFIEIDEDLFYNTIDEVLDLLNTQYDDLEPEQQDMVCALFKEHTDPNTHYGSLEEIDLLFVSELRKALGKE